MTLKKSLPAALLITLAAAVGFASSANAIWGKPGTKKLYYTAPGGKYLGKQEWYCNKSFSQTGSTGPHMVYIDYGCGA